MANDYQMHAEGHEESTDQNQAEQNLKISNRPNKIMDQFLPIGYIDVGDEMCWRQLWDIGDGFGRFVTNILYLFTLASGTYIQKMSSTSKFCHQFPKIVTNTYAVGPIGPRTWRSLIRTQIARWWSNEESMDQDKLVFFCNKNLSKKVCQWMIDSDE